MSGTIRTTHSPALDRHMHIGVYGYGGTSVLAFPPAACDELEFENRGMLSALHRAIEEGHLTLFTLQSVDQDGILNRSVSPTERSRMLRQYDHYVRHEVIPLVRGSWAGGAEPLMTVGVGLGAFHAVNTLLKQPDVVKTCYGLSGCYEIAGFMDGVFDDDFYFNNPLHYMQNLGDGEMLARLATCRVTLITAGAANASKAESYGLGELLRARGVKACVEDWGDQEDNWPLWKQQLSEYLGGQ